MDRFKKKILAFFSMFFVLFGLLTSCATNEDKFTLVVGMEAAYPPFNWTENQKTDENVQIKGKNNEYAAGYDIKVAKFIAEDNNWNLEIVAMEWDSLIPSLQSGTINAICAGMSNTEERRQSIDFSDPYYDSTLYLVTRKNDTRFDSQTNFDLQNDLNGVKLVTQSGTFEDDIAQDWANDFGAKYISGTNDYPGAFLQVSQGLADAVICEYPVAQSTVNATPSLMMVPFDNSLLDQKYVDQTRISIGIKKGSENSELKDKINASLAKLSIDQRNNWMNAAVAAQESENDEVPSMWSQISQLLNNYGVTFGYGILNTLLLAIVGTVVGLIIGILVSQIRNWKSSKRDNAFVRGLKWLCRAISAIYVTVFRGTPMMVQAMILFSASSIWTGLVVPGGAGNVLNGYMLCGMIIICINTGAYMTENVRSGMNGVDKGQSEAAASLGIGNQRTLWSITLPQALRNSLPSIGNEFIVNIKDSSVLNVIGLTELYRSVSIATKTNYFTVAGYVIIAAIYLILTVLFSIILQLVDNKLNIPDKVNWFGIRRTTIDAIRNFFKRLGKNEEKVQVVETQKEIIDVGEKPLVDIEALKQAQREEAKNDLN